MNPKAVAIGFCSLLLFGVACGAGGDSQAVTGGRASGHEPPTSTSAPPAEPQLITATLEPRLARVGDRLAITIENVTDGPVTVSEHYLPLRHLTAGGRKMIWAIPLESIYQSPAKVDPDGTYGVNDIGNGRLSPLGPGAAHSDELIVPEVAPGRYQFVVPVCQGMVLRRDCAPGLQGDDCFIHVCPAQTVELDFTVIQ